MKDNKKSKSKVKASGLKSVFKLNANDRIMTSFGNGNKAVLEKSITDNTINNIAIPENFGCKKITDKNQYTITPIKYQSGADGIYIDNFPNTKPLDSALEKEIFDANFADNIHIQIAHQIMDIQKLMAAYANQLVYAFNNLGGNPNPENEDWIGTNKNYGELVKNLAECLPYFGIKNEIEIYEILCVIKKTRHSLWHENNKTENYVFKPENFCATLQNKMRKMCADRLAEIAKPDNFAKINKASLHIIKEIYNGTCKFQEFYDYIIRKDQKNSGFSITKLRENLLKYTHTDKFNKIKHKIYTILDFVIYTEYKDKNFTNELRACKDDDAKKQWYETKADGILEEIKQKCDCAFANWITNPKDSKYNKKINFQFTEITADKLHLFACYIYCLSRFLTGKEINELLTGLIHKFENIQELISVAQSQNIVVGFSEKYKMFADSGTIATDLRLVNSFARMANEKLFGKPQIYHAAALLGFNGCKKKLDVIADKNRKSSNPLRNFLISNICNTNQFLYLLKYANLSTIRSFLKTNALTFILNRMNAETPEQIDRYKKSLQADSIKDLVEKIQEMNWNSFTNLSSKNRENYTKIMGLYMNMLFQIVKNLVNVNFRYVIAIYRLEYDYHLLYGTYYNGKEPLKLLGESFVNKKHTRKSKQNFCSDLFKQYRNAIAHLNAVQSVNLTDEMEFRSYFGMYHCMMQKYLGINSGQNKFGKNILKQLNMPFRYNLARYNALSRQDFFDKNQVDNSDKTSPANN